MTQLICLAYQPGAYGSFVSWVVDRFSRERNKHDPIVTDDPLLPDGSGHKYVTYCKIQNNENFLAMMDLAKSKQKPWGYNIYAGWPVGIREDINVSMFKVFDNLRDNDKMILIECDENDHYMRYLRNEPTMDQARWYGMLEVTDEDDLYDRLKADVETRQLASNYHNKNLLRIKMNEINNADASEFYDRIVNFLDWEVWDKELFVTVFNRRKELQRPYYEQLVKVIGGEANTPAERVIKKYLRRNR